MHTGYFRSQLEQQISAYFYVLSHCVVVAKEVVLKENPSIDCVGKRWHVSLQRSPRIDNNLLFVLAAYNSRNNDGSLPRVC